MTRRKNMLDRQLETYFHLRRLNHRDGFTDDDFPRCSNPIPFGTSVRHVRYEQVTSGVREEEEFRMLANKYKAFDSYWAGKERVRKGNQ